MSGPVGEKKESPVERPMVDVSHSHPVLTSTPVKECSGNQPPQMHLPPIPFTPIKFGASPRLKSIFLSKLAGWRKTDQDEPSCSKDQQCDATQSPPKPLHDSGFLSTGDLTFTSPPAKRDLEVKEARIEIDDLFVDVIGEHEVHVTGEPKMTPFDAPPDVGEKPRFTKEQLRVYEISDDEEGSEKGTWQKYKKRKTRVDNGLTEKKLAKIEIPPKEQLVAAWVENLEIFPAGECCLERIGEPVDLPVSCILSSIESTSLDSGELRYMTGETVIVKTEDDDYVEAEVMKTRAWRSKPYKVFYPELNVHEWIAEDEIMCSERKKKFILKSHSATQTTDATSGGLRSKAPLSSTTATVRVPRRSRRTTTLVKATQTSPVGCDIDAHSLPLEE